MFILYCIVSDFKRLWRHFCNKMYFKLSNQTSFTENKYDIKRKIFCSKILRWDVFSYVHGFHQKIDSFEI